jgi:hypothetical protein
MRRVFRIAAVLPLFLLTGGCSTPGHDTRAAADDSRRFWSTTNFSTFRRSVDRATGHAILTSPELKAPITWDELVLSWNAQVPRGSGLKFEVRALGADRKSEFYTMGYWAEDTAEQSRESVIDQKDEDGDVQTDTLALNWPASRFQIRVTFLGTNAADRTRLRFLGASFLNTKAALTARPPNQSAWGKSLPVPERSQLSHPGGRDWCSPTSVSMVLAYWSAVLNRPELKMELADAAAGIYDKNWPGTGNWSFNAAFAGKFDRMRACVTRLADVSELETLVAAGIPPVVSVSYDLLHGRKLDQGNGHLVVCVGFTELGDVLINDPWADLTKDDPIRYVIPRSNLAKAWARSHQTVYLIYPENWPVPKSPQGRW